MSHPVPIRRIASSLAATANTPCWPWSGLSRGGIGARIRGLRASSRIAASKTSPRIEYQLLAQLSNALAGATRVGSAVTTSPQCAVRPAKWVGWKPQAAYRVPAGPVDSGGATRAHEPPADGRWYAHHPVCPATRSGTRARLRSTGVWFGSLSPCSSVESVGPSRMPAVRALTATNMTATTMSAGAPLCSGAKLLIIPPQSRVSTLPSTQYDARGAFTRRSWMGADRDSTRAIGSPHRADSNIQITVSLQH
jgi:hypothetical protein